MAHLRGLVGAGRALLSPGTRAGCPWTAPPAGRRGGGGGGCCDGFVLSVSASEGDGLSSKESVLCVAAAPGVLPASTLLWQGAARGLALAPCCFPSSECCRIQSTSGHVVNVLQQSRGLARSVPACLRRLPGGSLVRAPRGLRSGGVIRTRSSPGEAVPSSGEAELLLPANLLASLRLRCRGGWGGLSSSQRPRAGEGLSLLFGS